jgi:hypothetical protein
MSTLNMPIAEQIAETLRANGYSTCTTQDVYDVYKTGSVDEGTVGPDYDEALTDQILDQLDAKGVELP